MFLIVNGGTWSNFMFLLVKSQQATLLQIADLEAIKVQSTQTTKPEVKMMNFASFLLVN